MIEDIFASVGGVIAVAEYDESNGVIVIINDFTDLGHDDWSRLVYLDDKYNTEIKVRAAQGRDPVIIFRGAKISKNVK